MPKAQRDPVPEKIRIVSPGLHLAGSLASVVSSSGEGSHNGWTISEDERGLVLSKSGEKTQRIPWSQVKHVEYSD